MGFTYFYWFLLDFAGIDTSFGLFLRNSSRDASSRKQPTIREEEFSKINEKKKFTVQSNVTFWMGALQVMWTGK